MRQEGPPVQRQSCQLTYQKLPVTALLCFDEHVVLAGEGSLLCLYHADEPEPLATFKTFDSQAIHGIQCCPASGYVVVYGGRLIKLLQLEQHLKDGLPRRRRYEIAYMSPVFEAEDWILSACLNDREVMLVTAHNALLNLQSHEPAKEGASPLDDWRLSCAIPGSNTIFYTAHALAVHRSDAWLIAAGTAFGDIILWSCLRSASTYKAVTHYSFSAHEGSVFGINISPELPDTLLQGTTRMLASCSDDRTVRVWDISDHAAARAQDKIDHDTGFGNDPDIQDSGRPDLLARAMGHVSRIWHVRFASRSRQESRLVLRSCGEDATTITWQMSLTTGKELPFELEKLTSFNGNDGKHIWAVDNVCDSRGESAVVVGGSDGAIVRIPRLVLPHQANGVLLWGNHNKKDNVKAYQFLDQKTLVLTTIQGIVQVVDLHSDGRRVKHSFELAELASYSTVVCTNDLAFICGAGLRIYVYQKQTENLLSVDTKEGKISALFAHTIDSDQDSHTVAVLTARATRSDVLLQVVAISSASITVIQEYFLELPSNTTVTSSSWLTYRANQRAIALGLRTGEVAIYSYHTGSSQSDTSTARLVLSVHSEAVTALQWLNSISNANDGCLVSTSRDGTLALSELSVGTETIHMATLHRLPLSIGPNLEGLVATPEHNLLAYGFRNKHFVMQSVTTQEELFVVECGGAHRNWAVSMHDGSLSFVWTQASKLRYRHRMHKEHSKYTIGGHGREIKASAVSLRGETPLLATGAQDTDIKLWSVTSTGRLTCLHTLRQHNTGPQHIAFSDDGRYLFSSGGFEEFVVWRLERDCPVLAVGVTCESVHPRTGTSDLRITSFDAKKGFNGAWMIAMTYSDSRVAIWSYEHHSSWQCIAEADYLTSCPTSTMSLSGPQTNKPLYAVTATDGHISMWELASSLGYMKRHQAHQSAILSSVCYGQDEESRVIITGGDDNAIAFTKLSPSDDKTASLAIRRAHAAAVTALEIFNRENMRLLFSAGLDQRLIVWQLITGTDSQTWLSARKLHVINSGVADVCGLDLLSSSDDNVKILITGVGMEIWTIPLPTVPSTA